MIIDPDGTTVPERVAVYLKDPGTLRFDVDLVTGLVTEVTLLATFDDYEKVLVHTESGDDPVPPLAHALAIHVVETASCSTAKVEW